MHKTHDGVDFVPGMILWTFEGITVPTPLDPPVEHGDSLWITAVDGKDFGILSILFSSAEAAKSSRESPANQCFCCGTQLELAHAPRPLEIDHIGAIYEGLFFRTTGNFGSAIFDPMNYELIEIVICDVCIVDRQHRLIHKIEKKSIANQPPPYKLRDVGVIFLPEK